MDENGKEVSGPGSEGRLAHQISVARESPEPFMAIISGLRRRTSQPFRENTLPVTGAALIRKDFIESPGEWTTSLLYRGITWELRKLRAP
jgi:hypothetical protein